MGQTSRREFLDAVLNLFNTIEKNNPSCANQKYLCTTAFIDSAASTLLLQNEAPADVAKLQEPNFFLKIPNGGNMYTETTMCHWLAKLPPMAWRVFFMKICKTTCLQSVNCDAGCTVIFQQCGVDIESNGEIILQGWWDPQSWLWHVLLTDKAVPPQKPPTNLSELQQLDIQAQSCNICGCEITKQLMEFYLALFFSLAKSTWLQVIKQGYLCRCPGLVADQAMKYIHVKQQPPRAISIKSGKYLVNSNGW